MLPQNTAIARSVLMQRVFERRDQKDDRRLPDLDCNVEAAPPVWAPKPSGERPDYNRQIVRPNDAELAGPRGSRGLDLL